jgi:hypothetical protein
MGKNVRYAMVILALSIGCVSVAAESENPYIGHWALTIPGGGAGWLGVEQVNGELKASILWGGGSVVPVSRARIKGDILILERDHRRKRSDGKVYEYTETIIVELLGDKLTLTQVMPRRDGNGENRSEFTGKRTPPLPPKPDLSKAKYGKPIKLFNGRNLDGWKLTNPRQTNGWSVEDGVLVNNPKQTEGEPHISYGNLRTEAEFEDFNLKLEVNVGRRNNSGVYLRGIYEVQVSDAYGKRLDSHNMGGIYSRITPIVSAEKPAGQWQTLDMTLVDRHVTVKLNGKTIIDNQPLLGCTGGALWADQFRPGPIYLQGDHTGISYRNIVLTPIIEGLSERESIIFEDGFDGKPDADWSWLRENPSAWRIREGALEVRNEPGAANNVKNALLLKAPDRSSGKFAIDVTVTNHTVPTQQYEQAGITWYNNGKPVFKLVKELVDGQLMIIPGRKLMSSEMVQLRLIVMSDSFVAQYRPNCEGEFQTAETGKLPAPNNDQVSIQCYHGPANAEHWIRFDSFRISKLPD